MQEQRIKPDNKDLDNESGRISRSGTSAGISEGAESSSGGADPIQPGTHVSQQGNAKAGGKPKE